MTRKAAVLFAATSVIWGSSFLFIRVAVEHLPPSAVVFGRTALGTAFLLPLALWLIRSEAVDRKRFTGLLIGLAGVIALLGLDFRGQAGELLGAAAVLASALGYAGARRCCTGAGSPMPRPWASPR